MSMHYLDGDGIDDTKVVECPACYGTGENEDNFICKVCEGEGVIPEYEYYN